MAVGTHSLEEALCSPGNPATVSRSQELGQWLCVPSFRMVCLFRTIIVDKFYIIVQ
jgi:hypothetical protein